MGVIVRVEVEVERNLRNGIDVSEEGGLATQIGRAHV